MNKKSLVAINYTSLLMMNLVFYYVYINDPPWYADAAGLFFLAVTAFSFIPLHMKSGAWRLTHADHEKLDEREIKITHEALGESYGWFAVICLLIILAQSLVSRMNVCPRYAITVPLAGSLIYLAHTLPGSFLLWKGRL